MAVEDRERVAVPARQVLAPAWVVARRALVGHVVSLRARGWAAGRLTLRTVKPQVALAPTAECPAACHRVDGPAALAVREGVAHDRAGGVPVAGAPCARN